MRINSIGANKFAFKSLRTDKNTVSQLKTGEKPIIENNKLNILTALNSIGNQPDRQNIEFLLDVADNLAYGQGGENSQFKTALDEDGFSPSDRENTDWSKKLKDTISLALAKTKDDVSDLNAEYERIFAPSKELTNEQKEILGLRKTLTEAVIDDETLDDSETLRRTANVLKNLDYFVASSEIPTSQKKDVLGKLTHFMSDEYQINPQLEDKKLQALDEMLGDMLVKTPESDILTTKPINQRQSGICASISICRKAMAHEDKSKYVELIMEELSASDKMHVYDITELGTGKKIEISKPEIEYTTALKKGYRIVDTAAHIWMNNAHASGDGSIQTEYYVAFDDENYGIFNDSSWFLGLGEDLLPEKLLLTALIKENEYLKSFKNTQKQFTEAQRNISSAKKEAIETQTALKGALNRIFDDIFPEKANKEISSLFTSLIKFYKGKDETNKVNIPSQLPKEVKQDILADYLINQAGDITSEQENKIHGKRKEIFDLISGYAQEDAKIDKLQSFNSKKGKYVYNKKLFNVAAAHRIAIESDINTPNSVARWEKNVGLPPRNVQISNYLEKLTPKDEKGRKELMSDIMTINSTVPKEIDEVTSTLLGYKVKDLAKMMFTNLSNAIQNGDKVALENTQDLFGMQNKGKNEILDEIQKWESKLVNPTDETLSDAIRTLGYENRTSFAALFVSQYYNSLRQGISQEEADSLAEKFGGMDKISKGLEEQRVKFETAIQKENEILTKWEVPSARALILDRLEHKYKLISRSKLDKLKNRFEDIQTGMIANEEIENTKERAKANEKLFTFTKEEQEILDQIEKQVSSMKKYQKINYLSLNKVLFNELEAQYANIGMLNGQFWVREEGSSGLSANEQIRIIEQMTGKPYHMETDIKKAAKQIKEGNGSGIISMSVLHDDYGFHAQYVPAVTTETLKDPKTNEKSAKDIVWTDNSWGNAERDSYWDGHDGFLHTDYGSGYGWEKGFILAPDGKIGLQLDDINGAVGVATNDGNEKFGLFTDVVLEGMPVNANQKLYDMFQKIIKMDDVFTVLDGLEKALTSGYKINVKELESLDELSQGKIERIKKRAEKEIKSEEDYNKLPEDDELKFAFDKVALILTTNNPMFREGLYLIDNVKDLKEAESEIFQATVEELGGLIGKSDETFDKIYAVSTQNIEGLFEELKTKFNISLSDETQSEIISEIFYATEDLEEFDGSLKGLKELFQNRIVKNAEKYIQDKDAQYFFENNAQKIILDNIESFVRIKSLEDPILTNSPMGEYLINSIDKHLKTKNDKELLDFIQALQHTTFEEADKFFDMLSPEDVGIEKKSGYECLKLFNADDSIVSKALQDSISTQEIYKNMRTAEDENQSTPEECFRDLYVKLCDMDVQKYIQAFKAEAFQKYKVRQAFPNPVVVKDENITEYLAQNIISIRQGVDTIAQTQLGIDTLESYHRIADNLSNTNTFKALMRKEDVQITPDNKDKIEMLAKEVITLATLTATDKTIQNLNEEINKLAVVLRAESDVISGKEAGLLLKDIITEFERIENSGNNLNKFVQDKKNALNALNKHIDFLVTGNIEPKQRDLVRSKFNKLVTAYKNGVPEEETDIMEEELNDLFIDKHIVKNPLALLREVIQMLQDGKQNTPTYTALKTYLESTLKVAQQTKIQYKLVQNQHEAIGSKTKNLLGLFNVYDNNGLKQSMDSDMGMYYLVEKLNNENDNHITLNLFLEQAGLTERALNALVNVVDLKQTKTVFANNIDIIKSDIKMLDKFTSITEAYFKRIHIPCKNWSTAVELFTAYAQRQLKQYKDTEMYKYYMECLKSIKDITTYDNQPKSTYNSILQQGNVEALYQTAQTINAKIQALETYAEELRDKTELLCSIRVKQSSEASKKRTKFIEEQQKLEEYFAEQNECLQSMIENSEALATIQN